MNELKCGPKDSYFTMRAIERLRQEAEEIARNVRSDQTNLTSNPEYLPHLRETIQLLGMVEASIERKARAA